MHPLISDWKLSENDNVICCSDENLYELFTITDYLISDYSAVVFDFSVFKKPILLYVPDYEEYRKETGLCIDYIKEMPIEPSYTIDDLVDKIIGNKFNMDRVVQFRDKYFEHLDGKSCQRVVEFIESKMKK